MGTGTICLPFTLKVNRFHQLPRRACFLCDAGFSEVDQAVFGLWWTDIDLEGECQLGTTCNNADWRLSTPTVNPSDLVTAQTFLQTPGLPDYVIIATYRNVSQGFNTYLRCEQSFKVCQNLCPALHKLVPSSAKLPCMPWHVRASDGSAVC